MSFHTLIAFAFPIAICCAADMAALDKQDADFARQATIGGITEVRISEGAIKRKLLSTAETEFAKQLVHDHQEVNKELATIVAKKDVSVPTELDTEQQKKVEKLLSSEDKGFAERYLDAQIDDHKSAIKLFEDESTDGKDPDLKAFAGRHLPHLKAHLESAKALEAKH